jgi:predicted nucleic acid-binding protein
MGPEVFVDTSGFYALLVAGDAAHAMASAVVRDAAGKRRFVTTDYVLDEAATLLKARGCAGALKPLFDVVLNSNACRIVWVDSDLFHAARLFFAKHADQPYSFTDCVSFVVMRMGRIRSALTTDAHFRQAGFEVLLSSR